MSEILLNEDVAEAWCYVIETLILCCSVEAMADKDFRGFMEGLSNCYPAEYEAVLEVLRKKEYFDGI